MTSSEALPLDILLSNDEWFAQNTLIYVFRYLEAPDLLRASQVCRLWHQVAFERCLWRTVTVREHRIHWTVMGLELAKLDTIHLRIIDCIFMLNTVGTNYLLAALKQIPTLRKIEFSECSSIFVERLPEVCSELEEINLNLIGGFGVQLHLEFLSKLPSLRKVSLNLNREITTLLPLLYLKKTLKHLSLTDVQNLQHVELDMLSMLECLESLTLGNCWSLPQYFRDTLVNLKTVKKLRLEHCRECHLNDMVLATSQIKTLQQLELIGINVDKGFHKVIAMCGNIRSLLIVPNARRLKSADGNTQIVDGVLKLKDTLNSFTLGFSEFYLQYTKRTYDSENSVPFVIDLQSYQDTVIQELLDSKLEKFDGVVSLPIVKKFLSGKLSKVKVSVVEWNPKWPYTSNCKIF